MQQLQTPYALYMKDTLDVSAAGGGRRGGRGGLLCALRAPVPECRCRTGVAAEPAAHWPGPPPLPPRPPQLVKMEGEERLALGAGKPFERHLP